MGYYTHYRLHIENQDYEDITNEVAEKVSKKFSEICVDDYYAEEDWLKDYVINGYDTVKWYDYEEDMVALSAAFPEYVFYLEGVGEDYGDWWKQVFYAGRKSGCNVVEEPMWPNIP